MADAGQFAKDADILLRTGTGANSTVKAAGWFDTIVKDVEAFINSFCRFDFTASDTSSTLNASVRGLLVETAACLAANVGVTWDMSGYSSRTEAEDLINVNRDTALRNLSVLRDKKTQAFIKDPTIGTA